ncbi:MAG: hypothetical protein JOZ81_17495 [Chloroflexi bacterium]|nr:hypothetical protein [Chloroflexota bacterium]
MLEDAQRALHDAAGREIAGAQQKASVAGASGAGQGQAQAAALPAAAQQAMLQDAREREEEAVSLQQLLPPMFRQAEAALQLLEQRSAHAAARGQHEERQSRHSPDDADERARGDYREG